MNRKTFCAMILVVVASLPLRAAEPEPCKVEESETPYGAFLRCAQAREMEETMQATAAKVEAQASSAVAADASGSRVSDSLTDLLPLLQGAITPVNSAGDGTPVVLNFNTPPIFRGKTSLQATLAEPEIFAPLNEEFPEAIRAAQVKKLLDQAGGFGDATYSLSWSPVLRARNWSTTGRLFGRETETYQPLIEQYFGDVLYPGFTQKVVDLLTMAAARLAAPGSAANTLASRLNLDFDTVMNVKTFAELRSLAGPASVGLVDQVARDVEALSEPEQEARAILAERDELAKRFAVLIGNQPELQVRAGYRDADVAVGPRDFSVSVIYSAGTLNFNRLLGDYQGLLKQRGDTSPELTNDERTRLKTEAFNDLTERATKGDLWRTSYAITYRKIEDYRQAYDYTLEKDGPKTSFQLDVPGVEEWSLRLNYSQLMGPALFADKDVRPRIEFAVSGTWVVEDGDIPKDVRRQDRVIGRVTYTVPTSDNLTFPVSIVFANRPEFLMQEKDLQNQLSAHVGLSYKLPRPGSLARKAE